MPTDFVKNLMTTWEANEKCIPVGSANPVIDKMIHEKMPESFTNVAM